MTLAQDIKRASDLIYKATKPFLFNPPIIVCIPPPNIFIIDDDQYRKEVKHINSAKHWELKLRQSWHRSNHRNISKNHKKHHLADIRRYRKRIQKMNLDIMAPKDWPPPIETKLTRLKKLIRDIN